MKLPQHGRYRHSSIFAREDYDWPQRKRLAFYVCVAVEDFAFGAGQGEDFAVFGAPQTQRNFAWRDYGQRIGLWRILEMLDELRIPVTFALNGTAIRSEPRLAERLRQRGDEIIGHGRTSSESTAFMWEDDEFEAVRQTTLAIEEYFGRRPTGWASPGLVESPNTLDILARQDYRYVLDWPADDQPFWMNTRAGGRILSVPFPVDTNDISVVAHRRQSGREFADMIVAQFEEMVTQCEKHPLVLPLVLHPYIVGQPFRLRPLRKALNHCIGERFAKELWLTRPGDIASHCIAQLANLVP